MATTPKIDLVAIVGATASGKSALAMEVARQFDGEIIAADSRTIYKGMDIGTAKPSQAEQKEVPHWGLDLVLPGQSYSAQRFKDYAGQKITDINSKGKLAILVGGTGLYVDSILYNFRFGPAADIGKREELEKFSIDQLQDLISQNSLPMPENLKNKRHLIRTIERRGQGRKRKGLRPNTIVVGLALSDQELKQNISRRSKTMFEAGILDETQGLINKYGQAAVLKTGGIIYKICVRLLRGEIDEQTATTTFIKLDWQYARRQGTWFRRSQDIKWFDSHKKAFSHLKKALST
jgi:tRNA dimethylallyltransferase